VPTSTPPKRTQAPPGAALARSLALLAVAGFCLGLLLQLPLRWVTALLPRGVHCSEAQGTLWQGHCGGLRWQGGALGDLDFRLHPLSLLTLRLAADVHLKSPTADIRGRLALGWGVVQARALEATLPLSNVLVAALPAGVRGQMQTDLERLDLRSGHIHALVGRVDLLHLMDDTDPIGDYRITFPPGSGDPIGELHDLGGPLDVQASLHLAPSGFVLEGRVAARASAPAALARQIRYLGSPDAAGRRPFSVAGTL
jgi:general secretion pathway protein N